MLSRACNNAVRNKHMFDLMIPFLKRTYVSGAPGSGAGKGGGAGGAINQAGAAGLGKFGSAQEEGYFYNKTKEQLEKLKKVLKSEGKKTEKKKE